MKVKVCYNLDIANLRPIGHMWMLPKRKFRSATYTLTTETRWNPTHVLFKKTVDSIFSIVTSKCRKILVVALLQQIGIPHYP